MEAFEKAYRAGLMSWKDMGKTFGLSMRKIKEISDLNGWTRDLGVKIQKDAQRKDQEQIACEQRKLEPKQKHRLTEKEVTESNVELIAQVSGSHRATLSRARRLGEMLFGELEAATVGKDAIEQLLFDLDGEDSPRANAIAKLAGIGGRADTWKKLVDGLVTIVKTERDVLRISESGGAEGSIGSLINRVMGSAFKPVQENAD